MDHGVGSTDHFSALKIWMIENKFVSWDHGVGSTDHLSRQTMRIKTVMNHNQENDQKNRPHDGNKMGIK